MQISIIRCWVWRVRWNKDAIHVTKLRHKVAQWWWSLLIRFTVNHLCVINLEIESSIMLRGSLCLYWWPIYGRRSTLKFGLWRIGERYEVLPRSKKRCDCFGGVPPDIMWKQPKNFFLPREMYQFYFSRHFLTTFICYFSSIIDYQKLIHQQYG